MSDSRDDREDKEEKLTQLLESNYCLINKVIC